MNQSIGASGEELSFTIYWIVWGFATGTLLFEINGLVNVVPSSDSNLTQLPTLFLSAGSFSIASTMMQNNTHLLMTTLQISNTYTKC